jgi:biotin carboxyl carrier protein
MRRRVLLFSLLLLGFFMLRPASAATPERLFAETGWRVNGRLLEYWTASGGLPVFGFPIGPAVETTTAEGKYLAQNFERERLELHPELQAPYDVLLGRLGDELLRRSGRNWRAEGNGEAMPEPCREFTGTGRRVCGPFLAYWRSHGLEFGDAGVSEREALALFGLPLTAPKYETNSSGDRVLTQWFERARFEYHPGKPASFQVLLGRLGAEWTGQKELAPPGIAVKYARGSVMQGRTTTVEARAEGATAIRGTLDGVALPFVRVGDTWRSFVGVPVLARPGRLSVRIEADLPDGRTSVTDAPLTVLDAGFGRERITLPQEVRDRLNNNREAIAAERALVNAIWPRVTPERLWSGRFILPAQGRVSSQFGTIRSYDGGPYDSFHEGLDIANVTGTPIVAPARGRVVLAQPDLIVRGGAVILDHGQGIHSGFWHQSQVLVKVGDIVEQGQIIGRMGAKGMVTGPHLHWDVRIGSINVHPQQWVETNWP